MVRLFSLVAAVTRDRIQWLRATMEEGEGSAPPPHPPVEVQPLADSPLETQADPSLGSAETQEAAEPPCPASVIAFADYFEQLLIADLKLQVAIGTASGTEKRLQMLSDFGGKQTAEAERESHRRCTEILRRLTEGLIYAPIHSVACCAYAPSAAAAALGA